jgi:hypothetical protein
MRISSVEHPHDFQDGLAEFGLRDLRRIVVLAGPNGSGKTRLLRRILLLHHTSLQDWRNPAKKQIREQWLQQQLKGPQGRVVLPATPFVAPPSGAAPATEIHPLLFGVGLQFIEGELPREHLRVLPLNVHPTNWESPAPEDVRDVSPADPGSGDLAQACLPYIFGLQAQEPAKALSEMVREFLGADLEFDGTHSRMFGQPIASSKLSEGQQILLQWAVRLHALDPQWDGDIYTLDEPENYLHPKALV